jgi:hypothetical protein
VNVEFQWWLLLVGLAGGAALAWLILADLSSREGAAARTADEDEVAWIVDVLGDEGVPTPSAVVDRVLELHRAWTSDDVGEATDAAFGSDMTEPDETPAPTDRIDPDRPSTEG